MEWMDRPSVTEMDRGGVYEMDSQTKCKQKVEMPLKWINFNKIFGHVLECVITFYPVFGIFLVYPFHRPPPLSNSVTLGLSIHFIDTSSSPK